jgi:hypothetical protein
MAFPSAPDRNDSESPSGTSHVVNLPANIVTGNLLIVQFTAKNNPVVTWPAGWTDAINDGPDIANASRTEVHYRFADGSEGATITITTDTPQTSGHRSWRIVGAHETTPPEGAAVTGASATPDPPNLDTTAWDLEDSLWLALAGATSNTGVTAYPTNYTNTFLRRVAGGPTIASAERSLNVSAENPDTFTLTAGSAAWRAVTVAVRPASADTDSFAARRSMVS